ncbi:MAG TPA: lysophospholipid acyltransferase family protein [Bdellovibrionota bacterium]|nr:lysophospholipid acyltransferase family protein [Bdellovibrionota bacterium]
MAATPSTGRLGRNPFEPVTVKVKEPVPEPVAETVTETESETETDTGKWDPRWGKVDLEFTQKLEPLLDALYTVYFRCDIQGWENVPDKKNGPALFVGNHNGLLTWEVLMLFHAWLKQTGGERPALGLAHGIAFGNPVFSWLTQRIGAIPAEPEIALGALKRGFDLMVYPGGEKESFRPFAERAKVDFFGRQGFLRLALKAGVPIVPLASIGAHETYVILDRGEELAERLGLKEKFRLHGLPITPTSLLAMWCLSVGLITFFPLLLAPAILASAFIPLPAKMDFKILPAVDVCAIAREMGDSQGDKPETLQRLYDLVVGQLQETVTTGYAGRKYPVVG